MRNHFKPKHNNEGLTAWKDRHFIHSPVLGEKNKIMKLETPKLTLAEMIQEMDVINKNMFQIKQFAKMACELIDKNEPVEKLKHLVDIFRPMEAIKNLEPK